MTTTRQYDSINRLKNIANLSTGASPLAYGYHNNANQRTHVNLADGSYWSYGYDALGQVVSGKRSWPDATLVPGQQYEYAFDTIGNRTSTKAGGDSAGANLRTSSYTPNLLNQYTDRTIPSAFDVMGLSDATATISINGSNVGVYRKGDYYQKALTVANAGAPVWQSVTVSSSTGGSVGPGYVFIPKTPEAPTHDLDGNLTVDGRWNYTWDAENRLIRQETKTDAPAGSKRRLDFEYDYLGRRIKKVVTNLDTSQVIDEIRFVYDGWNLIAQLNANLTPRRSFVWGLDLSGTAQGAGGVGGLLMVREHANGTYHFPGYDGNGNVATLTESANGNASATYEYGPFAEPIRLSGSMAKLNPFRFSTKYTDDESDLLYYGHRYYNPSVGRWLSRDPIEEDGGNALYGICGNDVQNSFDYLGLEWIVERKHGSRARVHANSIGDDIYSLARKVGLDGRQYKAWLQPADDDVSPCKEYTIPNVAVVVVGKTTFWPKPRAVLEQIANTGQNILYQKGFSVIYRNRNVQSFTADDITGYVGADLYGIAFFGHGTTAPWPFYDPNLGGDFRIESGQTISPSDMKNRFDYGLVVAYLCSAPFANWAQLVSVNGHHWSSGSFYQPNGFDAAAVAATFQGVE